MRLIESYFLSYILLIPDGEKMFMLSLPRNIQNSGLIKIPLLVILFHDNYRYLEKYGDHTNGNCKEVWSEAGVFFGLV